MEYGLNINYAIGNPAGAKIRLSTTVRAETSMAAGTQDAFELNFGFPDSIGGRCLNVAQDQIKKIKACQDSR
jgi:hypothetical protein